MNFVDCDAVDLNTLGCPKDFITQCKSIDYVRDKIRFARMIALIILEKVNEVFHDHCDHGLF